MACRGAPGVELGACRQQAQCPWPLAPAGSLTQEEIQFPLATLPPRDLRGTQTCKHTRSALAGACPPTLSIPSLGLGMRCVREAFRRDPGLRVPAKLSRESGGSRPGWNAGELAARMGARLRHTQPSQRTAPAPGPSTPLPLSLLIPSPTSHDGS